VTPDRKAFGAVRFCYVPQEMTIGSIGFDSRQLPNGVDLAIVLAGAGQRHAPPPPAGRVALITAVGDSEADVRAVIAAAESALRIVEAAPVRQLPASLEMPAELSPARTVIQA
jgi:hypothetical protein